MCTPFYLAVPDRNPLAGYSELSLAQLHKKAWVLFERHVHPPLYDSILRSAALEGVQPISIHHVVTAEEAAQEIYAGIGEMAFLTRAGAWRIARNGITMRPLRHVDLMVSSKLLAKANDASRMVSEFARALKRKLELSRGIQRDLPLIRQRNL